MFFFCLFVCQTASIFYSLAFKILWPEIFFPHSCSIEEKSSCATHSTTSAGKKSKLLKSAKNNPHVFRQNRDIFGDAKISHYTVFSISFFYQILLVHQVNHFMTKSILCQQQRRRYILVPVESNQRIFCLSCLDGIVTEVAVCTIS